MRCLAFDSCSDAQVWCRTTLLVLGSDSRAVASLVEAAQLVAEGRDVVLVVQMVEQQSLAAGLGQPMNKVSVDEVKDLNRGRAYLVDVARQYGVPVFNNVAEAVEHLLRNHVRQGSEQPAPFVASARAIPASPPATHSRGYSYALLSRLAASASGKTAASPRPVDELKGL